MATEISNLQPGLLWKYFDQICSIPHPSKHEHQIAAWVRSVGHALNLETQVDQTGNVVIRKPATPGLETSKTIVMQSHLDMVPQKNSHIPHDFEADPIRPYVDGEWVTAQDTTLGADNGIGVAAMMAVLEDNTLVHGPLEALFTIDEETGMTGAFGLEPGFIKADILLNLDSEDEGELCIGCAGGVNGNTMLPANYQSPPSGHAAFQLKLTGLKGGHSGVDIHLGRGNANKLMNRFLYTYQSELGIRIATISGGNLRNAIPRESFATVAVPEDRATALQNKVKEYLQILRHEFSHVEEAISLVAAPAEMPEQIMTLATQMPFLQAIYACPSGVERMSADMKGLVETSNNLAIVQAAPGQITVLNLLRSSVDTAKEDLARKIASLFSLAGGNTEFDGSYPGWKPNIQSPVLAAATERYEQLFGKKPVINAIHAGLECGLIGAIYPRLDMISFGPTIRFPHSPDEKVHVASVNKFWRFLIYLLEKVD